MHQHTTTPSNNIEDSGGLLDIEGGAISATFESVVNIFGHCEFTDNRAKVGGGLIITESKLTFFGGTILAINNAASVTGGGVYLFQSEMSCLMNCSLLIRNNSASEKGGGVHSSSSVIKVKSPMSTIYFAENEARVGGGVYLEMSARIYVLKSNLSTVRALNFTANKAREKGGAIFIRDGPHACSSVMSLPYITSECFLQIIENHEIRPSYAPKDIYNKESSRLSVYFSDNTAEIGPALYGGLISSCAINHPESTILQSRTYQGISNNSVTIINGTMYIDSISNVHLSHVTSDPIQVCLCRNGWPDCSLQTCPIMITKGEYLTLSVAAVDQVYQPISRSATVYSSFKSTQSDLTKHKLGGDGVCTNLTLKSNVLEASHDELMLQVEGPCKDTELSKRRIEIQFRSCTKCPLGFERPPYDATCECVHV